MSRDYARQRSGRRLFAQPALGLLTALACIGAAGCGGGSRAAVRTPQLPSDFLGIVSNDAFAARGTARASILAGERRTGAELVRQTFDWAALEPRPGRFDFSTYDAYMAAVARAGLQVLPVLFGRPSYETALRPLGGTVTATTTFPPARAADFASFAGALARRYGPHGTFWRAHPELHPRPIRSWQIWNEPNLPVYWGGKPDAAGYVAMLAAAARALRAVDRGAEIVSAGLPDSTIGVSLEHYLDEMLAHGARRAFDTLAIDPYASSNAGVLAATRQVRGVLDRAGLRSTPIWVTEIGWASGGPGSSFTVGPRAQANDVLGALTELGRLAATLRIRGVVYFAWRDAPPYQGGTDFWGLHTGLLAQDGSGKPALSAYYQAAGVLGTLPATPPR